MGLGNSKSKKQSSCLIVGLDNSGKSTIVNYLKPEKKRVRESGS
jgi:ribosome biogenesis GTPase A